MPCDTIRLWSGLCTCGVCLAVTERCLAHLRLCVHTTTLQTHRPDSGPPTSNGRAASSPNRWGISGRCGSRILNNNYLSQH
eukprot:4866110-Prymnesium_polylepis.2